MGYLRNNCLNLKKMNSQIIIMNSKTPNCLDCEHVYSEIGHNEVCYAWYKRYYCDEDESECALDFIPGCEYFKRRKDER